GLRNALLHVAPSGARFRTLLLTATLTGEAYDALVRLFPSTGPDATHSRCQVVSEVSLRPEPAFLIAEAATPEQRVQRVIEAVRFLPRPLLLYTTMPDDAREWERRLR